MTAPFRSRLSIALDLRHPFSYLALEPALRFGEEQGLPIDWMPLVAQTLRPPSPPGSADDRGVRHKRHRARMIAREIAVYAEAQGLEVRAPYRDGPADAANLAWLWVRTHAPAKLPEILRTLFRGYWAETLDASSLAAAADALGACALDPEPFLAWATSDGEAAADAMSSALAEAGLFQTPAYVLDDEVFYGRQHLPMIRWLLAGRSGPIPI